MRTLNESAIKQHALECSKKLRGGKFTRVGSDFIEEVEADVEAIIRKLSPATGEFLPAAGLKFTTGALVDKLREAMETQVQQLIERKVRSQPSVGCTLGRTR